MDDPAQEAGRSYRDAANSIRGGFAVRILAGHVVWMLGDNDWGRPVWRERKVPPDGKTFNTPSFDQYLLRPEREGLHMPSLLSVHNICGADKKHGARAIHLMRKEILEYDAKLKQDRKAVEAELPARPKDGEIGRGRPNRSDNISSKFGTSAAYLAAWLRDRAPEHWQAYMAGEHPSLRAAAIAAGKVKTRATIPSEMTIADLAAQLRRRFSEDERRRLAELLTEP
jgi:hypothetical protein